MQPSLLAIGGAPVDPSALMSTLIDQGDTAARESGHRNPLRSFEIWFQGNESRGGGEPQVLHTDGFPIRTGGKG